MNAKTFCEHFATFAEAPGGVAKLRELILQLAVQGKLVPQYDHDEPALQSLHRHWKSNEYKQTSKPTGPTTIPENWCWATVGDLLPQFQNGESSRGGTTGIETVVIRLADIRNGKVNLDAPRTMLLPESSQAKFSLRNGDVLIVRVNGSSEIVGRMILCRDIGSAIYCDHFIRMRVSIELIHPEFFGVLSNSVLIREQISRLFISTAGQKTVNQGHICSLLCPLPPLAEQRRIVAKVDQLLGLCDELAARQEARRTARERLVVATLADLTSPRDTTDCTAPAQRLQTHFDTLFDTPNTIPHLRQTILQLAIQGKLVSQDPNDESTSDSEKPLGDLLREDSLNGYSKAPSDAPIGVPILRISAGTSRRDFIVDETDHKWVSDAGDIEKFVLQPNDLLACRFNGNLHYVGRFSLYLGSSKKKQINPDKLIRFRVDTARCDPRYVCFSMNARQTRDKIEAFCATTAGNIGISATNLKTVTIRVPPVAEQKRIVAKVTELLAWCDTLERQLQATETTSSQLLTAAVQHLLNGRSPSLKESS